LQPIDVKLRLINPFPKSNLGSVVKLVLLTKWKFIF